jgi:hypothetical protein
MAKNRARAALAAFLALALAGSLSAAPAKALNLPRGAKAAWVLKLKSTRLKDSVDFDVDRKGGLWLLPDPKILLRRDGLALVLAQPVDSLAFDPKGGIVLVAGQAEGRLGIRRVKAGLLGFLRDRLVLPGAHWSLADWNTAFGPDHDDGGFSLVRLSSRRRLLVWPRRILAAARTPEGWVLSTPDALVRVDRGGRSKVIGRFPGGATGLAYVPGVGLAVAGPAGVGLLIHGVARTLLMAPSPRVRAHGRDLYVLVPSLGGVLKISGLQRARL